MQNGKKWVIRVLIGVIIVPLIAWGVILWRNSSTPTYTQELYIPEINRVFHPPAELGAMSYRMGGSSSVLLFSSAYEMLDEDCQNQPLAELQLSDVTTSSQPEIAITTNNSTNRYHFAHLVPGSTGRCTNNDAQKQLLYTAATLMVKQSIERK